MARLPAVNEKNLRAFFRDLDAESIDGIRAAIHNSRHTSCEWGEEIMDQINALIGGYGVEVVRGKFNRQYYGDIVAEYVNTGDTYNSTIVHDCVADKFYCTTLGDFVESFDRKYGIK
jgi:hypothetical protein